MQMAVRTKPTIIFRGAETSRPVFRRMDPQCQLKKKSVSNTMRIGFNAWS